MGHVLDIGDRLFRGELALDDSPFLLMAGLEPLAEDLAFVASFANVTALRTSEGLVVFDTGSFVTGKSTASAIFDWCDASVHTAVYTHGHVDHVMGIGDFEARGRARVISHSALPARFDRYRLTAGVNAAINARQFRVPGLGWPTDYRYPDVVFDQSLSLTVGGERIELHHDRGETDDHAWAWLPEREVLVTGDLFIWASPNCGNPQKVQRYPLEWAVALRKMAALAPAMLLPGHGPPIVGKDRVLLALTETAELLESIVEQTLAAMNDGATLDAVVRRVKPRPALLARPYLRPVYDEPEFIVRNLWRLYGGWWDGNPAHLKPPATADLAIEIAKLAGGARRLAKRAVDLAEASDHRLACELIELASGAAPHDAEVREAKRDVYRARLRDETSLMAKSIYRAAADD